MTERVATKDDLYRPRLQDEAAFEAQIGFLANRVFPDFIWCDFKCRVDSPEGVMFPDGALVARDYSSWIVVEVELARHSWVDHIRPQLTKMLGGRYTSKHRNILASCTRNALDPIRLEHLDIYNPDFLLIIDSVSPTVSDWCRSRHMLVLEATPFGSKSNDVLLCLRGDHPSSWRQDGVTTIAEAKLAPHDPTIVRLSYRFPTEFTETTERFDVSVGQIDVRGRNLCSESEAYLSISRDNFLMQLGHMTDTLFLVRERSGALRLTSSSEAD